MRLLPITACAASLFAAVALADPYDLNASNDNAAATTKSELVHGVEQWHDLAAVSGVSDQDWFRFPQDAYASYEVSVDSVSADLGSFRFHRIASDGTTILQSHSGTGTFNARYMCFANTTATRIENQYLAVRTPSCGINCGADDVYRIRFVETTAFISRFNNSGTQVTVVLLQNPTDTTITGTIYFWSSNGTLAGTSPFTLAARALLVLNASTVVPGLSGSITIAHTARYGELSGKSIALEPATGFSYDTPLTYKPR